MRCVHEASLYERNCFITLTYDSNHLPRDTGLDKRALARFMRRLRKKTGPGPRYFGCGEYGETGKRPHYHLILFNHDFDDKIPFSEKDGVTLYTSKTLQKLWPEGFVTVGDVTFESAAYVARYVVKKLSGEAAEEAYTRVDSSTGEFFRIQPEFGAMSRRPGIGKGWFEKWKKDCYPSDYIVMRGQKMQPPRYYETLAEEIEKIHHKRRYHALKNTKDNTFARLRVREEVKKAQIGNLKRNLD